MNKNLTEIIFIIDKSGSMHHLVDDTIGGFNSFVEEQKEEDGEAKLTTVLFSSARQKLYDGLDIREVPQMDRKQYFASGTTAMLDAIGETIDEVQQRIDNTPEKERPAHILCVITTDGMENASHTYSKTQIQNMIEHQTKGHGWEFIFLGANMDAVHEASALGINQNNAATYVPDSIGTTTLYAAVSTATKSVRNTGAITTDWCNNVKGYTDSKLS